MRRSITGRRVFNVNRAKYRTYDLDGPVQPEIAWLPISYDRRTQQGAYLMRMEPGAKTFAHRHPAMEEFLILEGDLTDSDGTVFKTGDFVSFQPGTRHNSWTDNGCLIAVFEWRPPAAKAKSGRSKAGRRPAATASRKQSPL